MKKKYYTDKVIPPTSGVTVDESMPGYTYDPAVERKAEILLEFIKKNGLPPDRKAKKKP